MSSSKLPWVDCYIGIGGNLGDSVALFQQAISSLEKVESIKVIKVSSYYRSSPMGPQDQDNYLNAVIKVSTCLPPLLLLEECQAIEQVCERVRKAERWGPRTLDLDLLLYDNKGFDHPRLKVPHYGLLERNFVIYPLLELAPNIRLPDGRKVSELTQHLSDQGLWKLDR